MQVIAMTEQASKPAVALSDKDDNYYLIPEDELARFRVSDEQKAKLEMERGEVQTYSYAGYNVWGTNYNVNYNLNSNFSSDINRNNNPNN
jgi:hypothetical protein